MNNARSPLVIGARTVRPWAFTRVKNTFFSPFFSFFVKFQEAGTKYAHLRKTRVFVTRWLIGFRKRTTFETLNPLRGAQKDWKKCRC